jgi:mono/diheme cytochrome c family protein
LFRRQKLENGMPVTEAAVRETLDKGSQNMPSFKDTLSPEEKAAIIAFLKSL